MNPRRYDTEESCRYWQFLDENSTLVAAWPEWKRGAHPQKGENSMGMVTPEEDTAIKTAIPKESALLKCENCGQASRVWLNACKICRNPESNWYEQRIARLEEIIERQNKMILKQVDMLNYYKAKLSLGINEIVIY